jgi:predicted ATP-grasp superfamily ATP-dependent carboligase
MTPGAVHPTLNRTAAGDGARVLLTDGEARAALAACRGLHHAGYEVAAVAGEQPAASHWSRACSEQLAAPDPRVDRAGFAAALTSALASAEYDVLLPGSDAALLAISEHRDQFGGTSTGLPDHEIVRRCLNKLSLLEAGPEAGLPVPETEKCDGAYEAAAAAGRIGYPVLIKPWTSVIPEGRGIRQRPSCVAEDPTELSSAVDDFGTPLLVQRRVVGSVHSLAGVRAGGEMLAIAFSRYRRTWPPDAGNVSCSESLEAPSDLLRRAAALLDVLGWEGIFEIELIRDGAGRFTLIDLNPRIYGSLELAIRAGAPIPSAWCDWLLGRPVRAGDAHAGVRYRWEDAEAHNLLHLFRAGRIRQAAAVMRPRSGTAHAYFRLGDPAPLVAHAAGLFRSRRRPKQR